ncbi:hypothetical protein COY16_04030 [Candidatus Roizmanbacteria bacterium CG_4_10_14_0_2_um_filter_39_13]|uniref:Helix-turn-helix domain-containing protein n=1 Tax=Candidatus Roizmanbacteria bacterium CG_4_10_14_0_2_um_filter_39_13 TaxID=1974825 RepID=A0A2M7TXI4_9BACT|nr:MAG: hypothetical protein COY16_04030 [Candidatus Roizmanbacteria bacterium CG_4_10_14_0_2_um_filter_39_13]
MEEYFSPTQISKLFSVSPITVRRWIKRGDLKAFKLSKDIRVRKKDLNNFLEQRRVKK